MKNKNENRGWIKLHRSIQNNWIWNSEEPFDRRSAWQDLIMMMNFKGRKFVMGQEIVFVPRGARITSERKLSEKWKWSRTKVRNFLELLKGDNMIELEKTTKRTMIKICNYDLYQNLDTSKEQDEDQTSTTGEPREDTNKNLKNFKNFAPPPPREGNLNHEIVELYFDVFGTVMNLFHYKTIENYINLHGFEEEAICLALTEAGENGADNFKYVIKILNEWHKQKAKTLEECQAILQRFQAKKNKSKATGGAAGGFHRNNSTEEEEPEDESIFNE